MEVVYRPPGRGMASAEEKAPRLEDEPTGRNGDGDRLRRKQLAARNTWETKTERLMELVHRELEADGPMA